jgi:hypothetical protein
VPVSRTRAARGVAMLSCALVLTLSACDTSESAPAGGGEHEGGHQAPHSGTHPSSEHRTTAPTGPSGEFNPQNCPTGRVC